MRDQQGNRYTYALTFTTMEEVAFITGLATGQARTSRVRCIDGWARKGANPGAFIAYARIVLSGMRSYDQGVDVEAVRRCIAELMATQGMAA